MNFLCKCGYRIHDSSDGLSYKGWIIADQDMDEFWHLTERKEEILHSEKADMTEVDTIDSRLYSITERAIYQCPSCGRVFIEDLLDDFKLIQFTPCIDGKPEPDVSKKLLISSYGEKWNGYMFADWYDEIPNWSNAHGNIVPVVNIDLDDLEFDDYEAFEKRFYELFEHLKGLGLITSARLDVNQKNIFNWNSGQNR